MIAAVVFACRFNAVADDPASAMAALRGEFVNGAFKAIEYVASARHQHFDRLVVLIAAGETTSHSLNLLRGWRRSQGRKSAADAARRRGGLRAKIGARRS